MKGISHYFTKAKKEGWAIGQFNFSDFTQLRAIVFSAKKMNSPVIIGTSEGESKFFGLNEAVALRDILRQKTKLPIFLNLDHGKSFEYIKQAIDAGYDMVHFDGSKLSLEENIKLTKQIKRYAKSKGVIVEGEVGKIGTDASKIYSEKFQINEQDLTKPSEARLFLKQTGIDLLAVSIGNFHGMEDSGLEPRLRLDRLLEIKDAVGQKLFVLHGGSGTNEQDIRKAISLGVLKININTELRLAFADGLRRLLKDPEQIVPYKFLPEVQTLIEKVVEKKIGLFGSQNKA